jgi:hypothetical protein
VSSGSGSPYRQPPGIAVRLTAGSVAFGARRCNLSLGRAVRNATISLLGGRAVWVGVRYEQCGSIRASGRLCRGVA